MGIRNIEFRGQQKYSGKWVYGSFFSPNAIMKRGKEFDDDKTYTILPETVGQYTGLKDKNGTKIFEGDIVRYTRKNWKEPLSNTHNTQDLISLHRIFYNEKYGAFWEEHIDCDTKRVVGSGLIRFNDDRADENIVEVIGNIYDNYELLECGRGSKNVLR